MKGPKDPSEYARSRRIQARYRGAVLYDPWQWIVADALRSWPVVRVEERGAFLRLLRQRDCAIVACPPIAGWKRHLDWLRRVGLVPGRPRLIAVVPFDRDVVRAVVSMRFEALVFHDELPDALIQVLRELGGRERHRIPLFEELARRFPGPIRDALVLLGEPDAARILTVARLAQLVRVPVRSLHHRWYTDGPKLRPKECLDWTVLIHSLLLANEGLSAAEIAALLNRDRSTLDRISRRLTGRSLAVNATERGATTSYRDFVKILAATRPPSRVG